MIYVTKTHDKKPRFKGTSFFVRLFVKRLIVDLTASLSKHESAFRRFIYESAERKPRRRADRDTNCSASAECMCVQPQPVPALVFEPKIVRCPHCTQTATTQMTTYFDCWPALAMLWCVHTCSSYLLAHTTSTHPL